MQSHKYYRFVPLPASEESAAGVPCNVVLDKEEIIQVTITLSRKKPVEGVVDDHKRLSREAYELEFGSDEKVIKEIGDFASAFNLAITGAELAGSSVSLKGKIFDFEKAFGVSLSNYRDEDGRLFRGRVGCISIPQELEHDIDGVLGLDERTYAKPNFTAGMRHGGSHPDKLRYGYTPCEVGSAYDFPTDADGTGQCIGIIALGGGYRMSDLKKYFSYLGLPVPSVTSVSVDGVKNSPSVINSADSEVMLNIEVAGAIAPGAKIVVYFTRNTDQGFLNAVTTAIHDKVNKPSIISISWGTTEAKWNKLAMKNFNEAFKTAGILGVTICVASGDAGSANGMKDGRVHVDFPASSPYVLACGGTKLTIKDKCVDSEVVWHAADTACSGGGISEFFPLPEYQVNAKVPTTLNPSGFKGRGLPDIAGNADYATGYKVLVDGHWTVIGGTSAVAPLYAGLIALLNQKQGVPLGFINPLIYSYPELCRNIIQGNNITARPNLGYKAGYGWNACAGFGILSHL